MALGFLLKNGAMACRQLHTPEMWRHAPREKVDCLVVGAGVVGLAIARALASRGREVLVVEAAPTFGTVTSSRNSEVIHAGIYYPRNSLKALLCLEGREMLYPYCKEHGVPHKRIGKLIVATDNSQIPTLEAILSTGLANGVSDLKFISDKEISELEPNISCVKALWSPSTGILDTHSFMLSLQGDAQAHGATFAFNSSVIQGRISGEGIEVNVCGTEALKAESKPDHMDESSLVLSTKTVINAAGLNAVAIASSLHGFPREAIPAFFLSRGCYFSFIGQGRVPFSHLVYPIPGEGNLGVHVTVDLSGHVKFGPDVEVLENPSPHEAHQLVFDYTVDPKRAEKFYSEIRKYYPALKDGELKADYAGIRPKLSVRRDSPADFVIQGEEVHGVCGLVNLFGIESPGLTASLAIANRVSAMLCQT